MDSLDYNLAYYRLTQKRANQLAIDQQRYIFVDFIYDNDMIKNIYQEQIKKERTIFKIEFTNIINGNFYIVKKRLYPETLYDYSSLLLDDRFYKFYLDNKYNPKYDKIDLRAVWYFLINDLNAPITIKWVRDNKYIFSYKRLCSIYTNPVKEQKHIKVCCRNVGLLRDPKTQTYYCPEHFNLMVKS